MCGIAGYICDDAVDPRLDVALSVMGIFMTDRGRQSWGWSNGTDITKNVGLLRTTFGPQHLGHKQAMIHTRHGTGGAIIADNSHPFNIKGIIGAHNGIIYNHTEVAKKFGYEYKVDSELIFHIIADGHDLSELKGYGAIVFWRDGIFHIGRFQGGDMELMRTEFGWVYCSTKDGLLDGMGMAGLDSTAKFQVDLKEGVLYQLIGDKIVKAPEKLSISSSNYKGKWQDYGKPVAQQQGFPKGMGAYAGYLTNNNATLPKITSAATVAAAVLAGIDVSDESDGFYDPLEDYHNEQAWMEAQDQAADFDTPNWKRNLRGPECDYCSFLLNGEENWTDAGDVICDDCMRAVFREDAQYAEDTDGVYEEEESEGLTANDFKRYAVIELTDQESIECFDCNRDIRIVESAFVYEGDHRVQICAECYWENYSYKTQPTPAQHQLALVQ